MRQKRRQRKHKIARRTAFRLRMKAAAAVAAAGAHVSNSTIGEFPTLNGTRNNNNSGTCTKNVRKPKRRLRQGSTMVSSVQKSPDSRSKRQRRKVVNTSRATKVKSTKDNSDVTTTAVQKNTNDTPTTNVYRPSGKYGKFRNILGSQRYVNRRRLSHIYTSSETLNTSQLVTRKLLRSIRRRQIKRFTSNAYTERSEFIKKLCSLRSSTPSKTNHEAETLEDGEIRSDNEVLNVSIDDDCICIEPQVDEIIIDDDEPTTSRNAQQHKEQPKNIINWLTSTPCAKNTTIFSQVNSSTISDKQPLFYSDVSRMPWFETINSEDTFADYTKIHANPMKEKKSKSNATPDEVIVLDDTLTPNITLKTSKKRKSTEMDDSVIFVSESKKEETADFIPLVNGDVLEPVAVVRNPFTPKNSKINNTLFTKSEKKQLDAYNTNAYNPNSGITTPTKKRMVIIDGSNVAYNHSLNKEFSVKGLKICIDYFDKMGHEVKAIVPQYRLHKSSDPAEMEILHKAGKIVFTPCKNLPGKSTASYDDRFVLQLASELDAAVVSNDNYRDLINENAAFKKIIENRVIGFTWCNDIFMVAKDPYGKWGPTLETILNRT